MIMHRKTCINLLKYIFYLLIIDMQMSNDFKTIKEWGFFFGLVVAGVIMLNIDP